MFGNLSHKIFATSFLLLQLTLAMAFTPPNPEQQLQAIGPTASLPDPLRRAFNPAPDFQPVPAPGPDDWLANHAERGQTFRDFESAGHNKPDRQRNIIYFQPLGVFPPDGSPALPKLEAYAAAFFQLQIKTLSPVQLSAAQFSTRTNPTTRNRQILSADVLAFLKGRLPSDAFCLLAITMEDLYPEPSWNFVFGQASLRERVGVYSFARYDPAFYGDPRARDYQTLLLRRSCKVLSHETAHMFGLEHCIYFACILNGSNHLGESDRRPMHLCPVCLRKLQSSLGFDVVKRYETLREFDHDAGFDDEARWLAARLKSLAHTGAP